MSLQKGLEQIERHPNGKREKRHSHKLWKNFRNRWLRRSKLEVPLTKKRCGWEF